MNIYIIHLCPIEYNKCNASSHPWVHGELIPAINLHIRDLLTVQMVRSTKLFRSLYWFRNSRTGRNL